MKLELHNLDKTHFIESIVFDFYASAENGEEFTQATVGKSGCIEIIEHQAAGEGDKWYYIMVFEDGTVSMTFNPNHVTYKPVPAKELNDNTPSVHSANC